MCSVYSLYDRNKGKPPDDVLCIADSSVSTLGSQVLRYSTPDLLQRNDMCELNFKDVYRLTSEI